jgi:peptidoglycan/LPS O-acetylase OafA/YrhL
VGRADYRNDIDGIRAVAVGLVLLFHADLAFQGGFVGVDVFFVISGYLISRILMRDITAGTFCFSSFWVRRIRRLFPALATMVAASFAVAMVLFVPEHLTEMSESIIAQPFLYANFLFWSKTGYFAADAESIPLLHTWSLAVEKQFYLCFPATMIWLLRHGPKSAARKTIAISLVSVAWSIYATERFPAAAFFLLPSRVWEFNIGVLLAMRHRSEHHADTWNPIRTEIIAGLGIALILLPAVMYDAAVPFPGIAALPPCLGTALLIHVHRLQLSTLGHLISSRPFVFTGKISYSLYLWHWPVFVFAEYILIDRFTAPFRALALVACWPIGWLSWKYIEMPMRTPGFLPRRTHLITATSLISIVFVSSGLFVMQTDGLPDRFPAEVYAHRSPSYKIPHFIRYDDISDTSFLPVIGSLQSSERPKVLLWGDSHAMSIMPAFDVLGKELDSGIFVAAQPGIPPLAGTWPLRKSFQPVDYGSTILEFVEEAGIQHVVLAARWNMYVFGGVNGDRSHLLCDSTTQSTTTTQAEAVLLRSLRETCQRLSQSGAKVWILRQVPFQPNNAPGTILKLAIWERDLNALAATVDEHNLRFAAINRLLDSVADLPVHYLDPVPFVVDDRGRCRTAIDNIAIYRDQDHLSAHGAMQLQPLWRQVLNDAPGSTRVTEQPTNSTRL